MTPFSCQRNFFLVPFLSARQISVLMVSSTGLLLFWYLEVAHSRLPQDDASCDTLNALIDEGLLEVEDLRLQMQDWPQSLPLAVTAELLSESTVWKCKIWEYPLPIDVRNSSCAQRSWLTDVFRRALRRFRKDELLD